MWGGGINRVSILTSKGIFFYYFELKLIKSVLLVCKNGHFSINFASHVVFGPPPPNTIRVKNAISYKSLATIELKKEEERAQFEHRNTLHHILSAYCCFFVQYIHNIPSSSSSYMSTSRYSGSSTYSSSSSASSSPSLYHLALPFRPSEPSVHAPYLLKMTH